MNAQKVEHKTSHCEERRDLLLVNAVTISEAKLLNSRRYLFGLDRTKANLPMSVGVDLGNFIRRSLPFSGVAGCPCLCERMEAFECLRLNCNLLMAGVNPA